MICKECGLDKDEDSFLLRSEECYRCVYKKKTKGNVKKSEEKKPINLCKICGHRVPPPKTAFCCEECAQIGWEKQRKDYWPRKIKTTNTLFKKWG